jgi:hypothetical protein
MSFYAGGEINLTFGKYAGRYVKLPAGQLLASGPKISFLPENGRTVYAYETNDQGNVIGYYLNDKLVSWETWKIKIGKNEDLRNSNFGQRPLCGMENLVAREASRFLKKEGPSDLPAEKVAERVSPATPEVEKPSFPSIEEVIEKMGLTTLEVKELSLPLIEEVAEKTSPATSEVKKISLPPIKKRAEKAPTTTRKRRQARWCGHVFLVI